MPIESQFEIAARALKVARLATCVPYAWTRSGIESSAQALEAATPAQRLQLAKVAGVRAPSDTTWELLVATVRSRRPGRSRVGFNRVALALLERGA